ncbi:heat shock transcription factor Hsf1 [Aspergillus ellipticus CBS 707.79]|uniref:Heat shock transcription factor Hsf1 n=1 Tax=Aspergillus ellipticus CBS 707.79 TaxID=1448320 RepID=A0A319D6F7_9EURO|nr:heat shock transcription factor Hsf1 [Aspergillus ellipticus CBS 707.79]
MSPQGVTRKRPAPGASPSVHPQLNPLSNYPQNTGNQLSNDQFLQWGQNPSPTVSSPSFAEANPYSATAYTSSPDVPAATATASGQLARRQTPTQQLVSRGHGYEQTPTTFSDQGSGSGESGGWGESLEDLYQRAMVAKRDSQAKRKQIPPFVQKLSSFLDESKNTELIRWSDDGNSFIVMDEDEFAKTLIPELFKHNNYASFVRQLNMYGFHKKVGLSDNSMRASERKNKSPSEYANPYFKRGHPDLLWLIQKPKNAAGQGPKMGKGNVRVKTEDVDEHDNEDYGDDGMVPSRDDRARNRQLSLVTNNNSMPKDQLAGVYRELQAIRQQQHIISTTISKLRREHEQLYAQAANFQEQHTRHENSINAILTFLATVYNRSLQGQEGPQNLANSFAGAISQDQGNVVDMGDDFLLSTLGTPNLNSPGGPRSMKKQPLLLKAPPGPDRPSRATTLSPATSGYDRSQSRGHGRQPSATQSGHVEEVFDNSPRQKEAAPANQSIPQQDIMSVIQNTNARNGMPTTFADFPNVLSSLETSNGNSPLTPNQRADMLRLMANEANSNGSNASTTSQNNALVTPTPPPMPHNYSGRLASTRAEIDNLVKMQAEQDRSVQNLTNLLQPLSPTGAIPGIGADGNLPPPPLDLDQIFSNDYFTDIADLEHNKANLDFGDSSNPVPATTASDPAVTAAGDDSAIKDASELFDFDHIPADGDLFGGSSNPPQHPSNFYNNFDSTAYGANPDVASSSLPLNHDSSRIETLPDSESTSPANTVDDGLQYGGSDATDSQAKGGAGAKRRRKA